MQKARGFTLLEVVVVLAIIAILTALAAPSFTGLVQSNAVSSNVNAFMSDLRFARSEAIRRGGSVVMCRSNDPEGAPACDAGSGPGGNGWVSGWIIFEDRDGSGGYNAGDQVLKVQGPITNLDTMVASNNNTFEFVATGRMKTVNSAKSLQFGTNMPAERQRMVCVNQSGRARIAGDGNSSCATDQ
ncbi:MAG: GspH/FimT family pseudopilin [Pseudomonadota bacterium]